MESPARDPSPPVLLDQDVKSKRYHLLQTHGDSFVGSFEEHNEAAISGCILNGCSLQASAASVLWGELFTEKDLRA